MSENKDYWKELLGDDFNEDLYESLQSLSKEAEEVPPAVPNEQLESNVPDLNETRFFDFDLNDNQNKELSSIPQSDTKMPGVAFNLDDTIGFSRDNLDTGDRGPEEFKMDLTL